MYINSNYGLWVEETTRPLSCMHSYVLTTGRRVDADERRHRIRPAIPVFRSASSLAASARFASCAARRLACLALRMV